MAAVATTADIMTIRKDSEILVKVDEALADLLVVSYSTEDKKFQGVLLDSNKGNLPFGVYSLHPAFSKDNSPPNYNEKLHSVSQRFTYQEPQYATENVRSPKKIRPKGKPKPQKMTVRLRARKVLCSKCQGICNESNENVVEAKKRKLAASTDDSESVSVETPQQNIRKTFLMGSMLIPKLSRLNPTEISNALKGSQRSEAHKASDKTQHKVVNIEKSCDNNEIANDITFKDVIEDVNMNSENANNTAKVNDAPFNSIFSNAKTIKICFGEGEGTVVKIPPIVGDYNEDSGLCDMAELKAAKKALKKARKQARKGYSTVLGTGLSPKHIGALSPRNNVADAIPNSELTEKKHKHKVKHKKRNKLPKERDENTSKGIEDESVNYFSDIKDSCLKQKLSISLQRLSSNSYEKHAEDGSTSEGWESDSVPNFPEARPEIVDGRHLRVSPGDIVWGKVIGFPWWPGRVLSVTPQSKAHVAWFASTTSSLMPCDSLSPFLEDYKLRFNKKKRGPYKEAVKQATIEAKQLESNTDDPLRSPTHTMTTVSPRPINVFS